MDFASRESIEHWVECTRQEGLHHPKRLCTELDDVLNSRFSRQQQSSSRSSPMIAMAQFQSDKSSLALSDCSGSMIFSNRPKLVPTAPSSRSRASSPTRKQIASLENAVPPVRIRPAGEVNTFQPAKDLHNYIHREFGLAVIPSCLKVVLPSHGLLFGKR